MSNKNLLVFIDVSQVGERNPKEAEFRWSYVYAHGKFEEDNNYDIALFNKEMPTEEGYFLATATNNKTVIVNLVYDENGIMKGRCCYIDDYEAMNYVNSPEQWFYC